jgi:hypothetical protein
MIRSEKSAVDDLPELVPFIPGVRVMMIIVRSGAAASSELDRATLLDLILKYDVTSG